MRIWDTNEEAPPNTHSYDQPPEIQMNNDAQLLEKGLELYER